MTLQEKAKEVLSELELKSFDDGRKIWVLKDDHSEYAKEFVFKAHEGMLPDDYKYSFIVECLELISESEDTNIDDCIYNLEPDIYTSDLTEWLNSNNSRVYYLTEVLEEMEIKDGFQALAMAQLKEKEEVFYSVFEFLENNDF